MGWFYSFLYPLLVTLVLFLFNGFIDSISNDLLDDFLEF